MRNTFFLSRVILVLVIIGLLIVSCGYEVTKPVDTKNSIYVKGGVATIGEFMEFQARVLSIKASQI